MKKKITLLLIVFSIFLGLATPKVSEAACLPGFPLPGFTGQSFNLPDCVGNILATVAVPIAGKAVDISARLFDFSIRQNMELGKYVVSSTEGVLSPVETIWKIIRDMSGMFFIFILIYASIQIILNGTNAKNAIVGVVVAALLVNFSLFFTKVIVDFSNTITLTIYSAIVPNGPYGLSDVITSVVSLQSLFTSSSEAAKSTSFNISIVVILFCAVATMIVMSIMFLAGAVMFLWRFIMLICLMAFSPFWAISKAIPQVSEYGDKFFKTLVGQAAFAPVFLFFIYIGMKVLTDANFIKILGTTNNNLASVFGEANGFIGPLFQYGLVIFIMFSGLGMASRMGGKGGEFGIKWMTSLGKWGQGALKGGAGFLGRQTYGRAANSIADTEKFKDMASKSKVAELALKGFRSAGSGYKKTYEENAEKRVKFAQSLDFNKGVVGKFENEIELNQRSIDANQLLVEDPSSDKSVVNNSKNAIKMNKARIAELKKLISTEKLRRASSAAKSADPRLDIKTGEYGGMTIFQRVKQLNHVSAEDEAVAAQIGLKNLEEEIKQREEKIKEVKEEKQKASEAVKRRKDEITKEITRKAKEAQDAGRQYDRATELDNMLRDDDLYNEKRAELYKTLNGKPDENVKGLIELERDLRVLKANEKKLK